MVLVIDVGNTNIVLGVFKDDHLVHHWRLRTERDMTEDEFHIWIRNLFSSGGIATESIGGTIISCVVPPMVNSLERFCRKYLHNHPYWVDTASFPHMPIRYDNPAEVGADRIVNAVAAFHKYRRALVVVDFGTATTFDCISADGTYLGGAISPGILISSEALFRMASRLPRVEIFVRPKEVIARNTVSSMNAGIVFGYAGLVDGMVERIRREMGRELTVIATGGLAEIMAEVAETIEVVEPHLTLEGLRIIYDKMKAEYQNPKSETK